CSCRAQASDRCGHLTPREIKFVPPLGEDRLAVHDDAQLPLAIRMSDDVGLGGKSRLAQVRHHRLAILSPDLEYRSKLFVEEDRQRSLGVVTGEHVGLAFMPV